MDQVLTVPELWRAFLLAMVIAALATPVVIVLARRIGAIDAPDEERRIHEVPTPRLGGIAMLLAIVSVAVTYITFRASSGSEQRALDQLVAVLTCAVGVALVGAWDDWRGMGWRSKLAGQLGLAAAVVFTPLAGVATSVSQLVLPVRVLDLPFVQPISVPASVGAAIAILSIVALMNMMNFIDGVDGLAAGISAISAGTFAIIAASYGRADVAIVAAATSGAAVGFLVHNFARGGARIFMGDAGSMVLGFLLAVIALQGVLKTTAAVSLLIPLALLAVPILDTLFVVSKRLKHGQSLASADRWHLHHRMLNAGYSPRRVSVAFWMWTASLSALALALRFVDYGNSNSWEVSGLLVIGMFALIATMFTVYLLVTLEIIKTRSVRQRNALARVEVVEIAPEPGGMTARLDSSGDAEAQPAAGKGIGHDRAAGIATDPRDDRLT